MSSTPLTDTIKNFQEELLPTIPEDTLDTLFAEMENLLASGIAEKSVTTGNQFPDFSLTNAHYESRTPGDFLDKGPLVISFYRGAWCPYCNLEINALQQSLPEISAAGGQLIAISPQTPDKSADQVSVSQLTFEVLSDVGNKLARDCGLVFTLPKTLRPIYQAWEIDIPDHNADDSFELPIPATYIVGTDGKIHYSFVNMDYTKRLEPNIIIEQLKLL
jgi:peroxiredoxin